MKRTMQLFLAGWLLAVACWAQKLPQPLKREETKDDRKDQEKPEVAAAKPATPGVGLPVDPSAYVIGGEDVLSIQTWRHPEFSFTMAVRPDGKISVPLVGVMQPGGMTPDAFGKKYATAIGDYVKNPEVYIQVLEVRSKKYFIDGEVSRAGEFPLIGPIRILEALSKAGGFRDFANKKKIRVLRGTQTFKFNWEEVIKGKNVEQNIVIQNGDHIIVP
jgi:polysaccharide export outer membrane protein